MFRASHIADILLNFYVLCVGVYTEVLFNFVSCDRPAGSEAENSSLKKIGG